ncbi:MAG: hypothetical protein ACI80W_001968, partial [Porticoccaceae bacterium]
CQYVCRVQLIKFMVKTELSVVPSGISSENISIRNNHLLEIIIFWK